MAVVDLLTTDDAGAVCCEFAVSADAAARIR
jgi:hypothetical protein